MLTLKGKYNTAVVYTDKIEATAERQILELCNQSFSKNHQIRIMPDVHAGAGCVIGFTADLGEYVIPNIVGVDIGCGMLTIQLGSVKVNFNELDRIIRKHIPSGREAHPQIVQDFPQLEQLHCFGNLRKVDWIRRSVGTLGGGNHFIEIDVDESDNKYLIIHTGSRNLGKQVADLYQKRAYEVLSYQGDCGEQRSQLIWDLRSQGREKELQTALDAFDEQIKFIDTPYDLCYLTGEERDKYLHDMKICQKFAELNRRVIANCILNLLYNTTIGDYDHFETVHNYIDHDSNMIRKGAVSARKGEKLLILINMRDGCLICEGKVMQIELFSSPWSGASL